MEHGDLAQAAAVLGAAGVVLVLLARTRAMLLGGLGVIAVTEGALALALVPASDLREIAASPLRLAALALAASAVAGLAVVLLRYPAVTPVLLLVAAPFRIPVTLGAQEAFLLLPLYAVLAAAVLALVVRLLRGETVRTLPTVVAAPAAALVAFACLSLVWSWDVRAGTIELLFFLLPFATLLTVLVHTPVREWLPRALAVTMVALGAFFAAVGLWQAWTHTVFFAEDLRVANSYTTYFRVTSLFKDPSLYGRHLVLATAVLLVALLLRRARLAIVAPLTALLFAGLYVSYSQSSMAVLFATALGLIVVLGDARTRRQVGIAAAALALVGAGLAVVIARDHSLREATSGRSRLVADTLVVVERHPIVGVGIGGQPRATRQEADTGFVDRRNASHTTPLTVAAELGIAGVALFIAFLLGAASLLRTLFHARRTLGTGLAAAFGVLFLQSLVYSGFFEDPIMWGVLGSAAASLAALPAAAAQRARSAERPWSRPTTSPAVVGQSVRGA